MLEVNGVDFLRVERNAGVSYAYGVSIHGTSKMKNFEMINNIFGVTAPRYTLWDWAFSSLTGGGFGTEALNTHVATPYVVQGNLFLGVRQGLFPADNFYSSATVAGFENFPSDLRLLPGSSLAGAGVG